MGRVEMKLLMCQPSLCLIASIGFFLVGYDYKEYILEADFR